MVSLAELQSVKLIEWSKTATSKPERRKFIKSSWISEIVMEWFLFLPKSTDSLVWKFFLNHSDFFSQEQRIHSSRQTRLETHHSVFIIVGQVFDEEYQFNSILLCESERFTRERDECTSCKCICGTECFTAAGRAAKRKINRSTERQTVKVRQQEWTDARTNTHSAMEHASKAKSMSYAGMNIAWDRYMYELVRCTLYGCVCEARTRQ